MCWGVPFVWVPRPSFWVSVREFCMEEREGLWGSLGLFQIPSYRQLVPLLRSVASRFGRIGPPSFLLIVVSNSKQFSVLLVAQSHNPQSRSKDLILMSSIILRLSIMPFGIIYELVVAITPKKKKKSYVKTCLKNMFPHSINKITLKNYLLSTLSLHLHLHLYFHIISFLSKPNFTKFIFYLFSLIEIHSKKFQKLKFARHRQKNKNWKKWFKSHLATMCKWLIYFDYMDVI